MRVVALLLAMSAPAQPLPLSAVIAPNASFRVAWDHPGQNVDGFRWRCDGAIAQNFTIAQLVVTPPTTAGGLNTYTATVPALSAGKHLCSVVAYNLAGDSDASNTVEAIAALKSTAPVELRFVIEIRK